MAKIAIIIGSVRHGGNTELLAKAFAEGAALNHEVQLFSVAELQIHGCTGCNACYKDEQHRCVQQDDMTALYAKLAQADILVFATPVYFYSVSSQLKCLIDRLHNPIRSTFHVRKLMLLAVAADTIPTVFDSVLTMYRSTLRYFQLEDGGVLTVPGMKEKGMIANSPALKSARQLGVALH